MSSAIHITLDEFLARPQRDDDQREELIEGELIVSPGAKLSIAVIVRNLRRALDVLQQKGYLLANDFGCVLGNHSMPVPDLAAVSESRADPAIKQDGWLIGSPELVIEVSSPSNRKLQRKAALYLEHGAEQVWVVYPKIKTVTVFTTESTTEANIGDALEFHGAQVTVDSIFPK